MQNSQESLLGEHTSSGDIEYISAKIFLVQDVGMYMEVLTAAQAHGWLLCHQQYTTALCKCTSAVAVLL